MIRKGAEANLYRGHWFGKEVVFKHRVPKGYRIEELDKKIRTDRTFSEARALVKVKSYGINVPQVFEIDSHNSIIIMKFIQGDKLKDVLSSLKEKKKKEYFHEIGRSIAKLHINGHVHGDITTSNILITPEENIFLIDFGLHEYSDKVENKSVDLHLLKRVLISSHGKDFEICFKAFLEGYKSEYVKSGLLEHQEIIKNINAIETRGRYIKPEERL